MATFGKKMSSAAAVACVWVGGSVILQMLYRITVLSLMKLGHASETEAAQIWFSLPSPVLAATGGALATYAVRVASGWPKLACGRLFLRTLSYAVFAWALLPFGDGAAAAVPIVAGLLGIAGAIALTWQEAEQHDLGTHVSPGSTLLPPDIGSSDDPS